MTRTALRIHPGTIKTYIVIFVVSPQKINMKELCNGNIDWPLTIEVYDWNSDSEPSLIGTYSTSLRKLMQTKRSQLSPLERNARSTIETTKHMPAARTSAKALRVDMNKRNRTPGYIKVLTCELHREPTFLDYIQSGSTDIELSLAIDFSASNDLVEKASLHYVDERDQNHLNAYEDAIRSVGDILLHVSCILHIKTMTTMFHCWCKHGLTLCFPVQL
jgi:hypothetical protein